MKTSNQPHTMSAYLRRQKAHFVSNLCQFITDQDRDYYIRCYRDSVNREGLLPIAIDWNGISSRIQQEIGVGANPVLWLSFHLGPYPLIPEMIVKAGRRILILLSDQAYNLYSSSALWQKEEILGQVKLLNIHIGNPVYLVKQALHEGWDVLAFIDGNQGQGKGGRLVVPFGLGQWLLRDVLLRLASLYSCSICFLYLFQDDRQRLTMISDWLRKNAEGNSKENVIAVIHRFQQILHQYPDQWKGWYFLHWNWIKSAERATQHPQNELWLPYPVNGDFYALEGRTMKFYKQSKSAFEDLCQKLTL